MEVAYQVLGNIDCAAECHDEMKARCFTASLNGLFSNLPLYNVDGIAPESFAYGSNRGAE